MRRADAGGLARDPAQRPRVVQLEHALADRDDRDEAAAVDGRDAAGLRGDLDRPRRRAGTQDRQRVAALVADRDPAAGERREVVRVGAGRRALGDAPGRDVDGEEAVRGLRGDQDGPAVVILREVTRSPGKRDAAQHAPAAQVDDRERVGIADGDRRDVRARVDDDALGRPADRDDLAGGRGLRRGRARRLRRGGQLVDGERSAAGAGQRDEDPCGGAAHTSRMAGR